ncbi:MAG: DUF4124 domain-containing protein [Vibrio sp.]
MANFKLFNCLVFFAILLPSLLAIGQDIYRWTDNQGITHFSDTQPPKGQNLQRMTLPSAAKLPTIPNQISALDKDFAANSKENQPLTMLNVEISNLVDQQTIRNSRGFIMVQAGLNQKLSETQSLQLVIDSQPYGAEPEQNKWSLVNIDRGTHTFSINIVENGKVIASSKTITVHLHRTRLK